MQMVKLLNGVQKIWAESTASVKPLTICKVDGVKSPIGKDTKSKELLEESDWKLNLVDELHKKCSTWLCRNYRSVILPVFESPNMVIKGQRKINSKTATTMLTSCAHYRFRQRLLNKRREYNPCHIVLTEEPYTSKTCGRCGWLHQKLGGNKTFKCKSCGLCVDRDVNGARNILLRHLTLSCPLVDSVGPQPRSFFSNV